MINAYVFGKDTGWSGRCSTWDNTATVSRMIWRKLLVRIAALRVDM
jgi:hypothetical protein